MTEKPSTSYERYRAVIEFDTDQTRENILFDLDSRNLHLMRNVTVVKLGRILGASTDGT